ncbi:Toll-Interacting Protein [Manis pentadactyla]|nr:Toll-Interacting Protein [Manis pentadactyla]
MKARRSSSPLAPPPYANGAHSFCAPEDLRAIRQMFPVIEDNGARAHQPLTHKEVKDLAEAVRTYGVSANYTLAQIERLTETAMTPSDWHFLTSIQYGMNEQSENVAIAPFFKHAVEKLDVYDLEEMEPDDLKSNFQF